MELHLEKGMRMFMERTFAERLQDAMRQRGFKQVDLVREADKYGVKLGKSHMSQYVSGKTVPRAEILCFLANCLQVDADWLLTGEGDSRMVEGNTIHNVGEKNTARKAEDRECAEGKIEGKVSRKGSTQNRVKSGGSIMREFMKSSKLDNVLYDVRGPVVEEANRMEDAGTQVLKLNIGNPAPFGFRAPDEVIYDMRRQLADCEGYSPAKGMFSARKAIMQYAQLKHIPNVAIEDIYTGNGVSELINLSMSALLDSGDEVLVPSPDYPLWTACVTLAGGTAVHYLCDEQSEWYPDIEDIRKKIMSMFTDPNHLRVEDPGRVEGNPVFIYLDAFCKPEYFAEFLPEYQNLDELKAHYTRGGLGDVKVKKFLNKVLQAELSPIRERRKYWEQHLDDVYEILKEGSKAAEAKAAQTLHDVRSAMQINYFDDNSLIK